MRPKKRILLIDTDEDRQSARRFVLVTHAFKVGAVNSAEAALALFHAEQFDLVACGWPLKDVDAGQLLKALRAVAPYVPQLLLAEALTAPPCGVTSDAVMLKGFATVDLLDRVHEMAARKRGPRKIGPAVERVPVVFAHNPLADRRSA
jgi:two-component system, OmpR family, response regulator CpxR